jgi:hypothetical protein
MTNTVAPDHMSSPPKAGMSGVHTGMTNTVNDVHRSGGPRSGQSGTHTGMTNTRNTPVEALYRAPSVATLGPSGRPAGRGGGELALAWRRRVQGRPIARQMHDSDASRRCAAHAHPGRRRVGHASTLSYRGLCGCPTPALRWQCPRRCDRAFWDTRWPRRPHASKNWLTTS